MKPPVVLYLSASDEAQKRFADTLPQYVEQDVRLIAAFSIEEAGEILESLQHTPEQRLAVVIAEQKQDDGTGTDFLIHTHQLFPETRTVLLAGTNDLSIVRKAKNAANLYRYIPTPWEVGQLVSAAQQALISYLRALELQEFTDALQGLNTGVQQISGELSLKRLLTSFMDQLLRHTEADRAFFLKETEIGPELIAEFGPLSRGSRRPELAMYQEVPTPAESVVRQLTDGLSSSSPTNRKLAFAVERGGKRSGYLLVQHDEDDEFFTDVQRDIAGMMANQLAISLTNVELLETLENQQKVLEETNQLVASQTDELIASFRYAERIQSAMLPDRKTLTATLPDSFVLYEPKQLVSGDFYWFAQQSGRLVMAVADSTGAGVPGAFLSAMCTTLLNQAVSEYDITEPAAILEFLTFKLQKAFENVDNEDRQPDGLMIGVVMYEIDSRVLVYAGSNRPLWMVREGTWYLFEGEERPIWLMGPEDLPQDPVFKAQQVDLQDGDVFYMFSDGLLRQYGGMDDLDAGTRELQIRLSHILDLPMPEQHRILKEELDRFKQSNELLDDAILLGLRF